MFANITNDLKISGESLAQIFDCSFLIALDDGTRPLGRSNILSDLAGFCEVASNLACLPENFFESKFLLNNSYGFWYFNRVYKWI